MARRAWPHTGAVLPCPAGVRSGRIAAAIWPRSAACACWPCSSSARKLSMATVMAAGDTSAADSPSAASFSGLLRILFLRGLIFCRAGGASFTAAPTRSIAGPASPPAAVRLSRCERCPSSAVDASALCPAPVRASRVELEQTFRSSASLEGAGACCANVGTGAVR